MTHHELLVLPHNRKESIIPAGLEVKKQMWLPSGSLRTHHLLLDMVC